MAFQTMKYLGVAYLLYMAWMTLKEHGALKVEDTVDPKSAMQVIVHAILINILNPKLSIFFFAFLPQFVAGRGGSAARAADARSCQRCSWLMTFVVFVGYGLFAAAVRAHIVISRPARADLDAPDAFAGAFAALGAKAGADGSMTPPPLPLNSSSSFCLRSPSSTTSTAPRSPMPSR